MHYDYLVVGAGLYSAVFALDDAERISRYRYAFRNEAFLYRKEGFRGVAYYLAKCGLSVLQVLVKAKGKKLQRCGIIIASMFRGFFFRPSIEKI